MTPISYSQLFREQRLLARPSQGSNAEMMLKPGAHAEAMQVLLQPHRFGRKGEQRRDTMGYFRL
jgi:hypothetical protein